jgi:hypothetical protein
LNHQGRRCSARTQSTQGSRSPTGEPQSNSVQTKTRLTHHQPGFSMRIKHEKTRLAPGLRSSFARSRVRCLSSRADSRPDQCDETHGRPGRASLSACGAWDEPSPPRSSPAPSRAASRRTPRTRRSSPAADGYAPASRGSPRPHSTGTRTCPSFASQHDRAPTHDPRSMPVWSQDQTHHWRCHARAERALLLHPHPMHTRRRTG